MQPEGSVYLFPGHQGRAHLSREALEKALRETMGLAGKHSPHGWRSALSTRSREDTDFEGELIGPATREARGAHFVVGRRARVC